MIDDRIKIMMLKGEKGDTYDDTELRAELEARLANAPYIGYTEDGTFELPIHTIDDSTTGTGTTWSSEKINDNITSAIYTYDGTDVTCNLDYSDVVALITNNYFKGALQTNISGSTYSVDDYLIIYDFKYIRGRSSNYLELYAQDGNDKYIITHTSANISITTETVYAKEHASGTVYNKYTMFNGDLTAWSIKDIELNVNISSANSSASTNITLDDDLQNIISDVGIDKFSLFVTLRNNTITDGFIKSADLVIDAATNLYQIAVSFYSFTAYPSGREFSADILLLQETTRG